MNSGLLSFATKGKAFNSIGTHQKFDRTAYFLIAPFIDKKKFPLRKTLLKFEGVNGPDGMKIKSKRYDTDHLWDPVNEIGQLPVWIEAHSQNMTKALKKVDLVKASFEASWMAHYITDGMTPAHHVSHGLITAEYKHAGNIRKKWLYWGRKGIMSSHVAFETGVSSSLILSPTIKVKFDVNLFQSARQNGLINIFKDETLTVAKMDLYDQFLRKGWTTELAQTMKNVVVPRTIQLIAVAWLLAYEQAGLPVTIGANTTNQAK